MELQNLWLADAVVDEPFIDNWCCCTECNHFLNFQFPKSSNLCFFDHKRLMLNETIIFIDNDDFSLWPLFIKFFYCHKVNIVINFRQLIFCLHLQLHVGRNNCSMLSYWTMILGYQSLDPSFTASCWWDCDNEWVTMCSNYWCNCRLILTILIVSYLFAHCKWDFI